jgi:Xaa-Pro dipeptidase
MKPGVAWTDCHLLAEREIVKALAAAQVLHNGDIELYIEKELGAIFFPHGLGHLIGCDVHDVGGYLQGAPNRSQRPGLSKLRTSRILEIGMILTNEPGCYFIDALIDAALANEEQARYLNQDVINRFRGTGGVRLEDVVLVTADGCECLSTCPRLVEEVEEVIQGGVWPPAIDRAPELKRKWTTLAPDGSSMIALSLPTV